MQLDREFVDGRVKNLKREGDLSKYTLLCNLNYVFVYGLFTQKVIGTKNFMSLQVAKNEEAC